jgi:hypothetical protein
VRTLRKYVADLYQIVATHLETMLADARDRSPHGFGLHVEQTFRRFLDCGRLERGFARVACPTCHAEMLVPWSWKTRGLCSSCDSRRMTETTVSTDPDVTARILHHLGIPHNSAFDRTSASAPAAFDDFA